MLRASLVYLQESLTECASSDREFVKSAIRGINNGGNRDKFFSLLLDERRGRSW